MKKFNYVCKDSTGKVCRGEIDATDRNKAIAALKERSNIVVSVVDRDATGGTQGYISRLQRYGIVAILIFGVAVLYFAYSSKAPTPKKQGTPNTIKASQNQNVAHTGEVKANVAIPRAEETLAVATQRLRSEQQPTKMTNSLGMEIKRKKVYFYDTNAVPSGFSSGLERTLNGLMSTKLGSPPPPLMNLSPADTNILKILDTPIVVFPEDDEATVERKKAVVQAKEALKEFIAQGGTPAQFVSYYHGKLREAFGEWREAHAYMNQLYRAGDTEGAMRYMQEKNHEFDQKGYKLLKPTPTMQVQ